MIWKEPYLNIIAFMLPAALNVLDRFHIAKKLGEAVDEVRRQEAAQLAADGYEPVLKNSRCCFLKRRSDLTIRQATKPRDLLMNCFKSNKLYSSDIVEGLSLRINLYMRKADGCRSFDLLQTSLYHTLGDLSRTRAHPQILLKSPKSKFQAQNHGLAWFRHAPFWGLWIEGIDDSRKFEFSTNAQHYGPARIQIITNLLKEVGVGGNADPSAPRKVTSRSAS